MIAYVSSKRKERAICIFAGRVFAARGVIENGYVIVADGLIKDIGTGRPPAFDGATMIDSVGKLVIPGLIDLHLHGLEGEDVVGGDIEAISLSLARRGVTTFVASVVPASHDRLLDTIARLVSYCKPLPAVQDPRTAGPVRSSTISPLPGATLAGVHLEGPYLSPTRAGALNRHRFSPVDLGRTAELLTAGDGYLSLMTVAPELDGALDLITMLAERGVVTAVGHSDATFAQATAAVDHGLRHATHTFNAMRPFHHRELGVVGAVLMNDRVTAEVIADYQHVHPAVVDLLLRVKGEEGTCLVSDASPLAGLPDGTYSWLGRPVTVAGTTARFSDGRLAGGMQTVDAGLRNLIRISGHSLAAALPMATRTPARILGLNTGTLEAGRAADLAILNDRLELLLTMVHGRIVFGRS